MVYYVFILQGSLYVFSCNTIPSSFAHKWFSVGPGMVGAPSTLTLQLPFCSGSELIELLFKWCYRWIDVVLLWLVVRWHFMWWVDLFFVALWCPAIYGTKSVCTGCRVWCTFWCICYLTFTCHVCGWKNAVFKHILCGCKVAPEQGRISYRHYSILEVMEDALSKKARSVEQITPIGPGRQPDVFVESGQKVRRNKYMSGSLMQQLIGLYR